MKKIFIVVIATAIAVVSACIANNAAKKNFAPEQMKVWVKGDIVYIETPDGNVWIHDVK